MHTPLGASNPAPCIVHLPTINTRSRARPGKCLSCPRVAPEGSPPRAAPRGSPPLLCLIPRLGLHSCGPTEFAKRAPPRPPFPVLGGATRVRRSLVSLFHSLCSSIFHSYRSLHTLRSPRSPPSPPSFSLSSLPSLSSLSSLSSLFPLTGTVFSQQTPSCPGSSRALLYPEAWCRW